MTYTIKEILEKPQYQAAWREQNLHLLQSWDWLSVKATEGWSILRLGLFPAENADNTAIPAAVISLQVKQLPITGSSFAYVPKLKTEAWLEASIKEQMAEILKQKNIAFVIYEFDKSIVTLNTQGLLSYDGHIQPQQTNQVILAKPEEQLFAELDGKYRRNIKKAQREGVTVSHYQFSSADDNTKPIKAFYQVMQSIYAHTKFIERDSQYFQTIWNTLGANDLARIFIAEYKNEASETEIVGAYLVVNDNQGAYELYGGVNLKGRDVEAGYLLKWEAIRYFNNFGLKYYDHWGVAPKLADGEYDKNDELYQISRFKAGFGGEYVSFLQPKVQVLNRAAYTMFLLAKKAKELQVKFKKILKS